MDIYVPKSHPSFYDGFQHTSIDRTPYTYLIGWSSLNIWYYGRQASKNCHPSNLFKSYPTSSRHVAEFIQKHGNPDVIQVRKVFDSIDSCVNTENKVLTSIFKFGNKNLWLNVCFHNGQINSTNKARAKCPITNKQLGLISTDDPRWKTGEIVGWNKGYKPNENQLKALLETSKRPKSELTRKRLSESGKGKHNNSGTKNPRFDPMEYHFFNIRTNEEFIGTRHDFFINYPDVSKGNISGVISGSSKQTKGWTIKIPDTGFRSI